MRKNYWTALALVFILPALLFTVSCARTVGSSQTGPAVPEQPETTQQPQQPAADQGQSGIDAEALKAEQAERERQRARMAFMNEDIYFEFDSTALLPNAQRVLADKAAYMRANPGISVIVEGHCDERGTNAYNMALGQRRADSTMDYLLNLGIAAGRLSTISYGEERPVDFGNTEEAWAKNRRAHFVIK